MSRLISWFSVVLLLLAPASSSAASKFGLDMQSTRRAFLRGEILEALTFFEVTAREAEEKARANPPGLEHFELAAKAYYQASTAARLAGQLQKAVSYGEKGVELAEKIKDTDLQLRIMTELFFAYFLGVRDFTKSKELIGEKIRILKEASLDASLRLFHEGFVYYNLAMNQAGEKDYENSISNYLESIRLHEIYISRLINSGTANENVLQLHRTSLLIRVGYLADTYQAAGKWQEALVHYQKAFDSIKEWHLVYPFEAYLFLGMGEIYLQQKDLPKATANFQKALAIAKDQRWPRVMRSSNTRLGDVYRQQGSVNEAIVHYENAIQYIESVRSLFESEGFRQSYFAGWLAAYLGMIDALTKAGEHEKAFHYNERARSRAFLDLLGSKVELARARSGFADVEKALQRRVAEFKAGGGEGGGSSGIVGKRLEEAEKEYQTFVERIKTGDREQASLMSVDPLTSKEVQQLLEPGQILLEYFVTPEKTFLWVVSKDRVKALTVPISDKNLVAKVNALRKAISDLGSIREYQKKSQDLYRLLLRPALSGVVGKELIIVPHGILHYLPFQALYSPRGRYLIEEYSLSYLSSASLLQFTTAKRKSGREKILAVGNPRLSNPAIELDAAESETREVARLYPGSSILVKENATEEKIKQLSVRHDVLHFATHAELKTDDPLSSAILFANEGKEDGRLEVREIFQMNIDADLVVLSGCETGLGKLSEGDEFVGLTRAFIYAGTPSVVASLWKVEDSSTAVLMASFYRNLRTMTKVEALRQAQLELIKGKGRSDLLARRGVGGVGRLEALPRPGSSDIASARRSPSVSTSHPYFWAPFILVGDGK